MLVVETIARIRRDHLGKGVPIKQVARDLKVARNTVRKVVRSDETSAVYARKVQPRPKLRPWIAELERRLEANVLTPEGAFRARQPRPDTPPSAPPGCGGCCGWQDRPRRTAPARARPCSGPPPPRVRPALRGSPNRFQASAWYLRVYRTGAYGMVSSHGVARRSCVNALPSVKNVGARGFAPSMRATSYISICWASIRF